MSKQKEQQAPPAGMQAVTEKSVLPILAIGAVWLLWALLFPLYTVGQYLLCAAVSAGVYFLLRGILPDKVRYEPIPQVTTGDALADELLKQGQDALDQTSRAADGIRNAAVREKIEDLEDILARPARVKKIIVAELEDVRKKYAEPRRTGILYDYAEDAESEEDAIEDYPVTLFLSQHGYFKKITPQSLRMSGEQKFKEDDALSMSVESSNAAELMFFTDKAQVYKTRASDFADGKASQLGDYLPAKLGMDEGESVMGMVLPGDYSGYMIFFFENGKAAKVELSAYKTTSNRRRLTGAYSDKSPLKALLHLREDREIAVYSTEPRVLIVNTALLGVKSTRTTQGVALLTLKKKFTLDTVRLPEETGIRQEFVYLESLHGTFITCATGLRAPPSVLA